MKRIASVVAVLVELVVLGYVTLMALVLTAWMETDSFAIRATETDWWIEGGKRMFVVGVIAAIFAALSLPLNRLFFRCLGFNNRYLAPLSAGAAFILIMAAGITGAGHFVLTKPFI